MTDIKQTLIIYQSTSGKIAIYKKGDKLLETDNATEALSFLGNLIVYPNLKAAESK